MRYRAVVFDLDDTLIWDERVSRQVLMETADRAARLPWRSVSTGKPATFYHGCFEVGSPADTFLKVEGTHGVAWINDFCLGRYWNIGPHKTLYVPAPLLKEGLNKVVVFEFEGDAPPHASLLAESILG